RPTGGCRRRPTGSGASDGSSLRCSQTGGRPPAIPRRGRRQGPPAGAAGRGRESLGALSRTGLIPSGRLNPLLGTSDALAVGGPLGTPGRTRRRGARGSDGPP